MGRNDLDDAVTVALSASNPLDLEFLSTSDRTGTATFSAVNFLGQELTVFNWPGYGMGNDDLGGHDRGGLFSETYAWPFVPLPTFSTMRVAPDQTNTISYNHETGHVVRYVHGTCSFNVPWVTPRPDLPPDAILFPQLQRTLLSTFTCVTDRCIEIAGLDMRDGEQIDLEAQTP